MGDIADGLIDGTFDSITGEYLGEGPGYPRSRHWGKPKKKKKKTPPLSNPEINRINVWKLLFTENYKGDFPLEEVAFEYCTKELKLQTNIK